MTRSPPAQSNPLIPHGLLLQHNNHLYPTLIDTGSTISFIDTQLAQRLHLPIRKSKCIITLASPSHRLDSKGITQPICLRPVIVTNKLRYLDSLPPHTFEIIDLDVDEYQFIIGTDLIPKIFGASIPTTIACRHSPDRNICAAVADTLMPLTEPPRTPNPSSFSMTEAGLTLHEQGILIEENEGSGYIPPDEMPMRASTSTPASHEEEYQSHRLEIMQMAHIKEALRKNAEITGFCNLPEAELRLKLDPELAAPERLNKRQYPLSHKARAAADPVIKRWYDSGKIVRAPPGCPYNNPLTVAPKKDDSGQLTGFRVCLDVRKLNLAIIEPDRFQIPLIQEVLQNMEGRKIFGEFDLAEAYLQFPLHHESRPYTAFRWGEDQYMFVGVPFGLYNMPSHFQRIITYMFSGITATMPYFDNIPFGSYTWDEHATHTHTIINTCNQYNLRIKPSSVKIGQAQLDCLGHLLTTEGIAISQQKLGKIAEWPLPQTGKQLASFLGLITYIRQHVRHFADLTAEFDTLKKTDSKIEWTEAREHAFFTLKQAIANAPILRFPDFNKTFYLATDASGVGIGGVLYQPTDGDMEIIKGSNLIAICSKKLNECQRRYSTYKKELYAIVYCLRQFHNYIWGHKLVIITDHMPLTYILTSTTLAHALQQWLDVIMDYQFTIKHRPGTLHVMPDALSRMYEACYTDGEWGTTGRDPYEVINQHHLSIDKDVLVAMSQPPPMMEKRRQARPKRTVSVASASRGGEIKIDIDSSDSDADATEDEEEDAGVYQQLDDQQMDAQGHPYNEKFEVKQGSEANSGWGLYTKDNVTIRRGEHVAHYGGQLLSLRQFWQRYPRQEDARYVVTISRQWYRDAVADTASLGRYINTKNPNNVSLSVNPRNRTARYIANRTIPPNTEVFGTYGIGNNRAGTRRRRVAAAGTEDDPLEHKYDESNPASEEEPETPLFADADGELINVEQSIPPLRSPEVEQQLLVAMERRGKVAPETAEERIRLIGEEHAKGHFGREAIYRALHRRGLWWPGIRQQIQEEIRNCISCLRFVVAKQGFDPATPITAALPWDHVQMDCMVGLPASDPAGYTAVLVLVDVCTGFVLLRPMIGTTAEQVAPALWQLFNDFGFPKVLQSDNGPEFTSKVIQEMMRISGIDHRRITPYQPRTDGKVERNIGTTKSIIKKHLHGVYQSWPIFVPWAQSCINNKITQLTGSTPFALMFGRRMNAYGDYSDAQIPETLREEQWAKLVDQMVNIIYPSVAERVATQKALMVTRLDKRVKAHDFKKGDLVMLRRTEKLMGEPMGMLEAEYTGPYMIASKNRSGAFTLVTGNNAVLPRLVRANQLKYVSGSSRTFLNQEYEVDQIVDHEGEGDNRRYKVRWKGYSPEEDTWEGLDNLHNAQWSIQQYLGRLPPPQVARRS